MGQRSDDAPSLNDDVVACDGLTAGDVVYFERIAARTFAVRVLRPGADAPAGRDLFRVALGARTSRAVTLRFLPVVGPVGSNEPRKES